MTFTPDRKRRKSQRSARRGRPDSRPGGAGPRPTSDEPNAPRGKDTSSSVSEPSTLSDQLRAAGLDLSDHELAEVFDSLDPVATDEPDGGSVGGGETADKTVEWGATAGEGYVERSEDIETQKNGETRKDIETTEGGETSEGGEASDGRRESPSGSRHPLLCDESWDDLSKFAPEVTRSLTALMDLDQGLRTFDRPMGPGEAMHLIEGAEAISRVTEALSTLALSVYERLGTPTDSGAKSTEALIEGRLNLTGPEARRRARMARSLGGRVNMEGQALPPLRPVMADKLHDGTLSAGQVTVVEDCLQKLPSWVDPAVSARVEADLVKYAERVSVADLREIFRQMLAHIDPDGAEPKDPSDRSAYFINTRPKRNGDWKVEGLLDPAAGAELHGLLTSRIESVEQLKSRAADDPVAGADFSTGADLSTGDGVNTAADADPAEHTDRFEVFDDVLNGDRYDAPPWAVVEATGREGGTPESPVPAGHGVREDGSVVDLISAQPTARNWIYERFATLISRISMKETAKGSPYALVVTAKAEDLAENRGEGTTGSGSPFPIGELTARGLNGTVFFHLMDEKARTVEVLTDNRYANKNQVAIITSRDQGCTFPGCDAPAGWCDANHVVPYCEGGKTEVNNLCLACSAHHHLMDRSEWEVRMLRDGRPAWIPPASLDPARSPILHSRFIAQDIIETLFDD